ncbi:MAG: BMP family ABC transporter substrate-binding protein [Alphaproteobacteria bacterium]|nr:BMP family ABC transporter substrate-binding protein [Alphaproteobacteria bacterium]
MKFTTMMKFVGLLTAIFTMASGQAAAQTKVGFVYLGPIGDHGWTYQHHQGVEYVKKQLGKDVKVTYVENVPEGNDSTRVIERLARSGHDIIFTTSFGYMNPTVSVAKKYPKVKFEHATGYKRADNVSTYSARFYEGRYVIGQIAGKMTKTNTIGYVASFPIPEVVRGINAAYLGAKSVNPKVNFKVIWVSSWFDPGKETEAAKALITQGADVLMQHTDSPAPMTVAEAEGVFAFGQASDMSKFGPKAHLTSIVNNWGPYYVERIKAVKDSTWKSQDTFHGVPENMVNFAKFGRAVPSDVKKMAEKTIAGLRSGKIHPFTGPINKQDGSKWVSKGEKAPLGDLLGMNFYVEGIDATIPQ